MKLSEQIEGAGTMSDPTGLPTVVGWPNGKVSFVDAIPQAYAAGLAEGRRQMRDEAHRDGWANLKRQCCADPPNAKRCVMVSEGDFHTAIAALPDHPETSAPDDWPDPDAPPPKSWWCTQCKVEVHQRRCRHCGKLKSDKA